MGKIKKEDIVLYNSCIKNLKTDTLKMFDIIQTYLQVIQPLKKKYQSIPRKNLLSNINNF